MKPLGAGKGGQKLAGFGDVREEFADGDEATGVVTFAVEGGGDQGEEIVDVAEKEVVFVADVIVEGGTADAGTVENVLNGDGVEGLFTHEGDERVTERVAGAANAAVHFVGATGFLRAADFLRTAELQAFVGGIRVRRRRRGFCRRGRVSGQQGLICPFTRSGARTHVDGSVVKHLRSQHERRTEKQRGVDCGIGGDDCNDGFSSARESKPGGTGRHDKDDCSDAFARLAKHAVTVPGSRGHCAVVAGPGPIGVSGTGVFRFCGVGGDERGCVEWVGSAGADAEYRCGERSDQKRVASSLGLQPRGEPGVGEVVCGGDGVGDCVVVIGDLEEPPGERDRGVWMGVGSGSHRGDIFRMVADGCTWIWDAGVRAGDLVFGRSRSDVASTACGQIKPERVAQNHTPSVKVCCWEAPAKTESFGDSDGAMREFRASLPDNGVLVVNCFPRLAAGRAAAEPVQLIFAKHELVDVRLIDHGEGARKQNPAAAGAASCSGL